MLERLRAKVALRLIYAGRHLLGMPDVVDDGPGYWDTCTYCGATGREDGSVEHAPDCPMETGLFPVTLSDMWPGGPATCEGCGTTLWPGDTYALIELEPDIGQVSCSGCAVLAGVESK